jgi:hypothetical protein
VAVFLFLLPTCPHCQFLRAFLVDSVLLCTKTPKLNLGLSALAEQEAVSWRMIQHLVNLLIPTGFS